MPCPADPQPPDFLDLAAPHSAGTLWLGIGWLALTSIVTVALFFSLNRRTRQFMPEPHARLRLWLSSISDITLAISGLFFGLDYLWLDALRQWDDLYHSACPAVTAAFSHTLDSQQTLGAGVVMAFAFIAGFLPKLWLSFSRTHARRFTT